ncbi:uncharacterized protein DNG_09155 [Cephalotrichum gorgonifer]|uniref:Uncharacterized protein n=1 Tax=Cephalotrichum gorgonifer TaxID=2041049 RepID=A0AAE8SZ11_9PEZI|nr:uncharacterized protein DNG_09155 [Cephalotrichum gorgonifer]
MTAIEQTQFVNHGYSACKSCGCTSFTNTTGGVDTSQPCSCGHKFGNHI